MKKNAPPEYGIWLHMKTRCYNPTYESFHRYGGRGITVCDRWRHSFEAFLQDMGTKPSPKHTLDRINNDGNYEPGNCRWATQAEQMANMATNHFVTYNGETLCAAQWGRRLGISTSAFEQRLRIHGITPKAFLSKQDAGGRSGIPRYYRHAKSKAGYKGVYDYGHSGRKWEAKIGHQRAKIRLGVFDSPEAAALAYDEAAKRLHGDYARLNFPQSNTEVA